MTNVLTIATAHLHGAALRWAAAACDQAITLSFRDGRLWFEDEGGQILEWRPDEDWSQAGEIIERECLSIFPMNTAAEGWCAHRHERGANGSLGKLTHRGYALVPLVAAMRCYVACRLGDEVYIPAEVL